MLHKRKKKSDPYKETNEAFLQAKAQEEGMHVLDNGVMYRVLKEGSGIRKPSPRSIVYVHYTGRLIDGTVFDDSGLPVKSMICVPLNNLKDVIGCVQAVNKKTAAPLTEMNCSCAKEWLPWPPLP